MMKISTILSLITLCILYLVSSSNAKDTIIPNQPLKDIGEMIISLGGQFELGYFNLGTSPNRRYLGIRYHDFAKDTIIWVANRNIPLSDTSGVLALTPQGTLLLTSSSCTSSSRWWTNVTSPSITNNPIARLLDIGNFLGVDSHKGLDFVGDYLWDSLDKPGSTFMPTVEFGRNLVTGLDKFFFSWKTENDPSKGHYTHKFYTSGFPLVFFKRKKDIVYRAGPWNGERFGGTLNFKPNKIYSYEYATNEKEIYFQFNLVDR